MISRPQNTDEHESGLDQDTNTAVAVSRGFVIRRSNYRVSNEYFEYCWEKSIPFISVTIYKKYALVSLDSITMSRKIDINWKEYEDKVGQYFLVRR